MSAIFLHSDRPPAAQVSGWTMSTARERQELPEAEAGELALAAGDGDRERGLAPPGTRQVLRRHRLLEPADVQLLDPPAEPDRGHRVVGVVRVHHQADVRPDRRPHGA